MKCEVIHIEFSEPSFSWASGLYFIFKRIGKTIHLVPIDKNGNPSLQDDGSYDISATYSTNKGITYTQMLFETDKLIHDRTLKILKLIRNDEN